VLLSKSPRLPRLVGGTGATQSPPALQALTRDRAAAGAALERPAADPETSAALTEVDERSVALPGQTAKKAKPEHSRLPSNAPNGFLVDIGMTLSAGADFFNLMPGEE